MALCRKITSFAILTLLLITVPSMPAYAQPAQTAVNITTACQFNASSNIKTFKYAHDGRGTTAWKSSTAKKQYFEVSADEAIQCLSIQWKAAPTEWRLYVQDEDGAWQQSFIGFQRDFLHDYVPVFGNHSKVRIEATVYDVPLSIYEIAVYGKGKLPASVQDWGKASQGIDLMVISCHPDDEALYMGGTLPYYAGQRKLNTVVVYMTYSNRNRQTEALNCLWTMGVKNYPVFGDFKDRLTKTLPQAKAAWGEEKTIEFIVSKIRQYRPKVIVTHDLNGEYGHGMHKLTAYATLKAIERSAIASRYPQSAAKFGTWQVLKCYLHIYPANKLTMNWNIPLPAFGGKTALDMAKAGYEQHVSQHIYAFKVTDKGRLSCAQFGLAFSAVGLDKVKKDFFENIDTMRLVDNVN